MVQDVKLKALIERIDKATCAEDLVGSGDGRKQAERALRRQLHPDAWPYEQAAATEAFARLQDLLAGKKVKTHSFDVTTKTRTYLVKGLAFEGKVSNLYDCTYSRDDKLKTGLLKLPRSVHDNDLVTAESKALAMLWKTGARRRAYFPRIEDSFKHRDRATRVDRRALVIRRLPGFISLAEVSRAYPQGLDPRDLAWMWRRCFAALSLVSETGLVHGAIVPEHILIHPAEHGVILCGFSSAVETGDTIKALGGARTFYAPEVLAKEPATVATDIYMLSKTMQSMLHRDAPRQFHAFINGCTFDRPRVRPQDPRVLLGEFDSLLASLYGARKFRVFTMPS